MKKKEHKHCPVCGVELKLKNKTGYCNHHRPRSGENNPFFGKHHNFTEEQKKEIAKKLSENSKKCWASESYRKLQKETTTGLKRSDEFKEGQRQRALKQFKDPKQREIRSCNMKESWENGSITPNYNTHPNFSKEELKFGKQLNEFTGKTFLRNQAIKLDDGKYLIPDLMCDNVIVEYLGNYWHADPNVYKADDVVHHGYTAEQIWERDEYRRKIFKEKGFKLIEVWSKDFKENPEKELQRVVSLLEE